MTRLRGDLPRRAWRHIYRVTAGITAASLALSIILTNVFMETFSAGINLQGLAVSIIMPAALGGPLTLFLMIKHEQLRNANVQLEHLATTDWLTGCLNRRAFTHAVTSLLRRSDSTGALLIIDADDFKSVNDRFGHQNGDEALRLLAASIRQAVRATDLVGRLGGEEFGVFLADTDPQLADQVAQLIRHAVNAIAFAPDGQPCPLSVSIGGATYSGRAEFGELYRLADRHLYQAKNTGRDRVAFMQAA